MIQFIKEETKTQYSKQFTEEILKKTAEFLRDLFTILLYLNIFVE